MELGEGLLNGLAITGGVVGVIALVALLVLVVILYISPLIIIHKLGKINDNISFTNAYLQEINSKLDKLDRH